MIGSSRFRALARCAGPLRLVIGSLTVAFSLTSVTAQTQDSQDSSVAVEQAIRVVGSDGRTQIVEMNDDARSRLAAGMPVAELTSVPLANGRLVDFALERFEVFPEGAELAATDGRTTTSIARPEVVYYRGFGVNEPSETVFLSVAKGKTGEMHMLSSHPKRGTSVITPETDDSGRTVHRLSQGGDSGLEPFSCGTDLLPQTQDAIQNLVEPEDSASVRSATTLEAEMVVDVSNYLYTSAFGSDPNRALAYVGNLIGASSAIYHRDLNVVLTVKLAHVWTTPDPFSGTSSSSQLSNYVNWNKANRTGVARDLAHYLGGNRSYGGIAYVGGVCSANYGYGVSNIYGTYTLPTSAYTWDVNCVSHEIGHNFNSPHTHCYSPPIDCCYANECACGSATADAGTIMSYCHLLNGGRGVGMYFHSRCVGVMRTFAEGRSCLTAYNGGGVSSGTPKTGVTGNGISIPNGDYTPAAADGTTYGSVKTWNGLAHNFVLRNEGTGVLNLGGPVLITGTNPSDFIVTVQPAANLLPGGTSVFQVLYRPTVGGPRSALVQITTNDPVTPRFSFWVDGYGMQSESFANTDGWFPTGSNITGLQFTQADTASQALKVWIGQHLYQPRVLGWVSGNSANLPYSVVGPGRYVRAKFHVYAGGQSTGHANRIPNLRMRVGNRFAVASVLEVLHHSNADPEGTQLGYDLRPSRNAAAPSVYRVDYDPIDVPYLNANAGTEYISRMFEAYAVEPQEDGYVALTESSITAYPALSDAAGPAIKLYAPERGDFSGTVFKAYNVTLPVTWPPSIQTVGADLPRVSKASNIVQLDTLLVPSYKLGIAAADILPGAASEDYNPRLRARIEEDRLYKIRFHASSAQATNRQAQIRFRARTAKFAWTQKLEVGGAWAIGTNATTGNAAIAQQALPGIGSQNPDKIAPGDVGGWYTVLMHSPMSRDIRADYGNVALTSSMPALTSQDGPGVHTGRTRRDILLGLDLIDSISPGPNAYLEKGQVNLQRVEIRVYPRGAD